MPGQVCLRRRAGALWLLAAGPCWLAVGVRDSSAHLGLDEGLEESTTPRPDTSTESAYSFVAEFDMKIPRAHDKPNDSTTPITAEEAEASAYEDEDTDTPTAEDQKAGEAADGSVGGQPPTSADPAPGHNQGAGTPDVPETEAADLPSAGGALDVREASDPPSADGALGGSTTAPGAPDVPEAEAGAPPLVDCGAAGTGTPGEVLGKLRDCTHELDRFARTVKDQHGRSRGANQHYVETLGQVAERLQGIRDMTELDAAFSSDQGKALKVLMAEADKVQANVESMTPAAVAAAAPRVVPPPS